MKKLLLSFIALMGVVCAMAQTYLEQPAYGADDDVHVTRTTLCSRDMRSYSFRYDRQERIATWVAYPLNSSLIGEGSRGDGWTADPAVPENDQAVLYRGFRYGSGYDRGHQIPSADRLDPEANAQTFRFTNATPQLHDFNGGIWSELEKVVRTWAKRSDTLYVVTGCVKGSRYIDDNAGNRVNIPSAYFKAVLRLNTDRYGEKHWSACAVMLPHQDTPNGTWQENIEFFKSKSLSIDELERQTGVDFYPLLEKQIGKQSADAIETTDPKTINWFWK